MNFDKRVHVVPHMHWDREWYFSTEESQILLVNNMEEIMEVLESNPDYPSYILDGQTAILEDYFQVKPENIDRVKKLVQNGRLIIGPWVSQTDEMTVGAESITRNLLYGYKDSLALGQPMAIGYLPDSFGQTSQLPMILNQFDIKYSIFWRGVSERVGTDKTEFYWESDDGSKVLVQLLPLGYAIGKYLPTDPEALKKRMDTYFQVLDKGATGKTELLPNGHDQMPIQQNIFEILDELRKLYPDREFFLSKYENVFEEIEKNEGLDTIKGEFLDGKYQRVHRSIFATRQDLKILNTKIENKITNILEPLMSIGYSLGFNYEHGLLEVIWKLLLKNHAHDSMGACCSDKVHQEIKARYLEAEERVDRLIDYYKRKIVEATPSYNNADKLGLFNFLPYSKERVISTVVTTRMKGITLCDSEGQAIDFSIKRVKEIDPGLIDRQIVHYGNYEPFFEYEIEFTRTLPSMGYEVVFVQEGESKSIVEAKRNYIETDFYKVIPNKDGTVDIFDKLSDRQFKNVFSLDDTADDGDEYDFSPLENEIPLSTIGSTQANTDIAEYRNEFLLKSSYEFKIPKELTKDRKRSEEIVAIPVNLTLNISKKSRIIQVQIEIDNKAKDHRMRLLVPTEIASSFSYASNQFGIIRRDVQDEAMNYWELEDWDERPDSIYPFLGSVSLQSDSYSVGVLTNSSREYEIIGEQFDTIAITLLRSVGVLGKEELFRRPGRPSGIKLLTPDSQLLEKLTIDLAWTTTTEVEGISRDEKEYLTPVETYNQMPYHAMKLNPSKQETPYFFSLFELKNKAIQLSTVKKAENSVELLARFYNPTKSKIVLKMNDKEKYILYSLKEEIKDSQFNGIIKPNQVVTVRI
ncbi:alpha-mannosidase [Streptococcus uberis]|uniref:glycoside hydrolase family 38 N-terminal domain-containing protein n=1 Tax=Streptococcus uberis TaxID=1349 RepID=UPI001FF6DC60|nr:glycoside hydrolase family 38 C-terminal domain-containing protein [Streptococcus uberis]MCK1160555.1 alpha-mannosidase [Streptococcus uberis]MCK1162345.1 alpha-mannosidase [Streptococcus uberis]MCK1211665.1 alpha-mannosidase [Streptococcus uberis]MCK1217406.1 alpha-mannosidase [Streptococcus uberis]MCK1222878.1 alpha-mannosidase [Streptococcus uberis]